MLYYLQNAVKIYCCIVIIYILKVIKIAFIIKPGFHLLEPYILINKFFFKFHKQAFSLISPNKIRQ